MRRRKKPVTPAERHRAWLELVDTDGPFVAVPALLRVWPQGMTTDDDAVAVMREAKPAFERAWERWDQDREDQTALEHYRVTRDAWIRVVLADAVGWDKGYTTEPTTSVSIRSPRGDVTVRPTGELADDDAVGAIVLVVDPVSSLRDPLDDGWATSPIDRMEELLRAGDVRIGVVTDGRWWALVSAQDQTMAASGVLDALIWVEEPAVRDALLELLSRKRLVGGRPEDRLTELFHESVAAAEQITEALGVQVRRAVELLVQALSDAALEAVAREEPDPLPAQRGEVYDATVTVMMRLVFLLFAEERGLLPDGRLFTQGYGISDELDRLEDRVEEEDVEALDATTLTWHRLLATSEALYHGASFEDLRLPSYGGSLFEPDRHAFLTRRTERGTLTIAVSDRVMLEVLRSVQIARLHGQPARPISFRDIDVEQIGYIYEGLLGYSTAEVEAVTVGLIGKSGKEPEMTLDELDDLAEVHAGDAEFADAIRAQVAETQPAADAPTRAALVKALRAGDQLDDTERKLLRVTRDPELRKRLRPYIGIIRLDLRDRPLVVPPGGVIVVETPSRATAGAHYTPRSLAEEVVEHALHPSVYERGRGPYDTPDQDQWRPLDSDGILELKVADIACGSGAFLVAAARYLAARLVEAWHREHAASGPAHEIQIRALRKVVASCLYGADINAMAVEMCKLSLWLVSLDPKLPFSFVDDKVLHGNSLLGLTDRRQLEAMHINPEAASRQRMLADLDVDDVLCKAVKLREHLATEVDDTDPQRSTTTKLRQLGEYEKLTAKLKDVADGVVAAGLRLGGKPGKKLNEAYENLQIAVGRAYPTDGSGPDRTMLQTIKNAGLAPTVPTDYERWSPLHWVLAVPNVMQSGGFDAVVGNPPFLGGKKVSGALGSELREWLVRFLAGGSKGNADLVAYFFLRATSLLNTNGNFGLIATNTIAQGDTREVGLDRMTEMGIEITRSVQSKPWPAATANLQFAAVWGTQRPVTDAIPRIADDVPVRRISTLLEATGRIDGPAVRLIENLRTAFIGYYALGAGFVVSAEEAARWIALDSSNRDVLYPLLNGEELNSRVSNTTTRWIIDFGLRDEYQASHYPLPYRRLVETVKSERAKNSRKALRERWWQFAEPAKGLRRASADLKEVLVTTRVSNVGLPIRASTGQVFNERIVVFASESSSLQAVLSSAMHVNWLIKYGTTHESRLTYGPTAVFETFPQPKPNPELARIGTLLETERQKVVQRRGIGLTKIYNLVHDPDLSSSLDADVSRLRDIHVELDNAVMHAYGWDDVCLDHGFHTYRQMTRWTVNSAARVEVMDRLLEENHLRASAQGEPPPTDSFEEEVDA